MDYHLKLGTNVVLTATMCSDLDPDPYLKIQGHMRQNTKCSKKTMAGDIAFLWTALTVLFYISICRPQTLINIATSRIINIASGFNMSHLLT